MAIDARAPGLTRRAVDEVADAGQEPDWLRAHRRAAWDVYEATPNPERTDEEWRRTDLRWLRWESLTPASPLDSLDRVPSTAPAAALSPSVTMLISAGGARVIDISPEARAAGVVALDLAEAARTQPALVRERLSTTAVTPEQGKFQALNAALWQGGALVHVPRGAVLAQPILVVTCDDAALRQPHLLASLGAGAQAAIVEWWADAETDAPALVNGATELFADSGSHLTYTHVQGLSSGTRSILSQRALVRRDATFTSTNVTVGGRFHKARVEASLTEPGASAVMNGAFRLGSRQFVDHHTTQGHLATDGTSDLLFAGVLDGRARSVYAGTIVVDPKAQRTNAYQNNRNLLLNSGTRADSIPRLEIMADDVRCTHGATTSTLEPSHLYYLCSRGLSESQARELIVEGYFEAVLDRVPHEGVRDVLRGVLTAPASTRDGATGI
ncbi:MAG: Fe-S cluster assembly protein SufD [Chloroflexi bacterium]|nr:Fe-S cluster assembly protein SufD [Chloroflexota bacterium]